MYITFQDYSHRACCSYRACIVSMNITARINMLILMWEQETEVGEGEGEEEEVEEHGEDGQ